MKETKIEICASCGRIPRSDTMEREHFKCTRCNAEKKEEISLNEYEKKVRELNDEFQN